MNPPRGQARIVATRAYLPEGRLSNEELASAFPDWGPEKIHAKTGIRCRRIAAESECASDLGVKAASRLFDDGVCRREDVDFLLFCTQSPDHFLPTTACLVQDRLGLPTSCGALDFNLGCSGFVYGLALAKGLVETGSARNVLLITAETYSKYLHPEDRGVRTIFGDAAAATLVSAAGADGARLGPFVFGTDGRGDDKLIVAAGAARSPRGREVKDGDSHGLHSPDHLFMNGAEVYSFTLRAVPQAFRRLLAAAAIGPDEVDYFLFHQANKYMLDALRAKLEIPPERFHADIESTGNTVSATIPIALEGALESGRVRPGDLVMLLGFGVGYSWAGALARL